MKRIIPRVGNLHKTDVNPFVPAKKNPLSWPPRPPRDGFFCHHYTIVTARYFSVSKPVYVRVLLYIIIRPNDPAHVHVYIYYRLLFFFYCARVKYRKGSVAQKYIIIYIII